jgi:hypothetical protein
MVLPKRLRRATKRLSLSGKKQYKKQKKHTKGYPGDSKGMVNGPQEDLVPQIASPKKKKKFKR